MAYYYSKKELTNMGVEGFALIDEFYGGGGRRGRKQLPPQPNYGAHATFMVTSRQLPQPLPPPPAAATTPVVAINHYCTASSSGNYSRSWRQQGYNNYHRYSPAESRVGWTPVVAVTSETTTTVVHGGYDAQMLMDDFKY